MRIQPVSIVIPYKEENDSVLIWMQKRNSKDELNEKLEFPGGKVEVGELPVDAAIREVAEEVGVSISKEDLSLGTIFNNALKNKQISLYVYIYRGSAFAGVEDKGSWFDWSQRKKFLENLPPANQEFLEEVLNSVKLNTYAR